MYRCQCCLVVSKPGQSRLTHTIHRDRPRGGTEIVQEVPVCSQCQSMLDGQNFRSIYRANRKVRETRIESERMRRQERLNLYREVKPQPLAVQVPVTPVVEVVPVSKPIQMLGRIVLPGETKVQKSKEENNHATSQQRSEVVNQGQQEKRGSKDRASKARGSVPSPRRGKRADR